MAMVMLKQRRVVVIDDSRVMQAMVETAFAARSSYTVVGVAADARTGAEMVRDLRPDIVTIDLCMPYLDGAALLAMLGDMTAMCKLVISDHAVSNIKMSARLQGLGAALCLGKCELVEDAQGFFRKVAAACARVEALSRPVALKLVASSASPGGNEGHPACLGFPVPFDEQSRLAILRRKNLANAAHERQFDLITRHVAKVTAFPVCLLTFIDRDTQWIKSAYGFEATDMPRNEAFCAYTIAQSGSFVVENAATDARFKRKAIVVGDPRIRTYAGYPLTAADGTRFGALCVLDTKSRAISRDALRHLAGVADIVAEMIEHRPAMAA